MAVSQTMADEPSIVTDSSIKSDAARQPRSPAAYLGSAILSGVSSVIFGSLLCVTAGYTFRGDAVGFMEYMIILLMWCLYSASVILPVSVFYAFPLMVLLRDKNRLTKFLVSVSAGAFCAVLCAAYIYASMTGAAFKIAEALGIGITYGAVFGAVAAQLPRRHE